MGFTNVKEEGFSGKLGWKLAHVAVSEEMVGMSSGESP